MRALKAAERLSSPRMLAIRVPQTQMVHKEAARRINASRRDMKHMVAALRERLCLLGESRWPTFMHAFPSVNRVVTSRSLGFFRLMTARYQLKRGHLRHRGN